MNFSGANVPEAIVESVKRVVVVSVELKLSEELTASLLISVELESPVSDGSVDVLSAELS